MSLALASSLALSQALLAFILALLSSASAPLSEPASLSVVVNLLFTTDTSLSLVVIDLLLSLLLRTADLSLFCFLSSSVSVFYLLLEARQEVSESESDQALPLAAYMLS